MYGVTSRIIALLLCLVVFTPAAGLVSQQQSTAWQLINYQEADCSFQLPLVPALNVTSDYRLFNGAKIEEAREYSLYRDRVIYVVRTYVTPTPAKALKELESYLTQGLKPESRVSTDKVEGKRWATPTHETLLFTTKKSILVFDAIARDITHTDAQRFLNSITVGGRSHLTSGVKNVIAPTTAITTQASPMPTSIAPTAEQNEIFKASELTQRITIGYKPEPGYTEQARMNNIQGVVSLRLLLGSDGTVRNISPIKRLPDGLTDNAIAAARRIKFLPAEKDGRLVSTYVQINYSFFIY